MQQLRGGSLRQEAVLASKRPTLAMSMSCSWTLAQQSQAAKFYAAADRWFSKARSSTCLKRPTLAMSMSCSWTPAQQSQAATFYAAADRWVSKARSSTCLKRPILAIVQLCNCAIVQLQVPIPCKLLPIHKCQFLANC